MRVTEIDSLAEVPTHTCAIPRLLPAKVYSGLTESQLRTGLDSCHRTGCSVDTERGPPWRPPGRLRVRSWPGALKVDTVERRMGIAQHVPAALPSGLERLLDERHQEASEEAPVLSEREQALFDLAIRQPASRI